MTTPGSGRFYPLAVVHFRGEGDPTPGKGPCAPGDDLPQVIGENRLGQDPSIGLPGHRADCPHLRTGAA